MPTVNVMPHLCCRDAARALPFVATHVEDVPVAEVQRRYDAMTKGDES